MMKMRKIKKFFLLSICFYLLAFWALADDAPETAPAAVTQAAGKMEVPPNQIAFQLVQDQFILNNDTIKSAAIIRDEGGYKGLQIELKPQVAAIFGQLTNAGIGKV